MRRNKNRESARCIEVIWEQALNSNSKAQPTRPRLGTERMPYPVTPDGRYFVVRGRLWRCSDPRLPAERRAELTRELMNARRDKGRAMRAGDDNAREAARQR